MKYKHGQRVTCEIGGIKITDAKISIDKDGTPFICQNERKGSMAEDKLAYKYSWSLFDNFTDPCVKNLKPLEKTFYNLEVGDIIVDKDGDKAKVIDVLPNSFLVSLWNNFKETDSWYTPQEAISVGLVIEGADYCGCGQLRATHGSGANGYCTKSKQEEMTLQQVCKELGRDIKIIKE